MRLVAPLLAAGALLVAQAAIAQETETPSSRPAPSPGNPAPTVAPPSRESARSTAAVPDDRAGLAAVRAQCVADRARFCHAGADAEAAACLSAAFAKLSPDCQSAVTALKEARGVKNGEGG